MKLLPVLSTLLMFYTFGAGAANAHSLAQSGWRLDASRCPDLIEDYRNRWESRRESRRDKRVTVCPRSAWVWDGPLRYRTERPAAAVIFYDARRRHYFRYGANKVRVQIAVK